MPNRILRDYTTSLAFDGLSSDAERLFVRLMMKADDFGRFHASPKLIRNLCFPQSEDLRANTVAAWLTELSARHLVFCYTSGAGEYLAIPKFRQRSRAEESKFPCPPGEAEPWRPPDDGQVTVKGPSSAHGGGDVFVFEAGGECGAPAPLPKGCARRQPQGWPKDEAQARSMAETGGADVKLASTLWLHYDGRGYWPQGSFVSMVKSKQGFNAQDLSDKTHVEATVRQAGREAQALQARPTMQL